MVFVGGKTLFSKAKKDIKTAKKRFLFAEEGPAERDLSPKHPDGAKHDQKDDHEKGEAAQPDELPFSWQIMITPSLSPRPGASMPGA